MNKLENFVAGITGLGAFIVLIISGSKAVVDYVERERMKKEEDYQLYTGKSYIKAKEFLDAIERGKTNASMIISGSYQLQDERFYQALKRFKTNEEM